MRLLLFFLLFFKWWLVADFTIGTFNIRRKGKEEKAERLWENRLPKISALFQEIQPDIIGFQEAIHDQIEELQKIMIDHSWIGKTRGASLLGFGLDEASPIFYKKNKFSLLDSGTFHIEGNSWWIPKAGLLPRICTWVFLEDKETKNKLYVFNIHIDHLFASARLTNLKNVLKGMENIVQEKDCPIILLGDFNSDITLDIENMLFDFANAKKLAPPMSGPCDTHTNWGKGPAETIDHILIKNHEKISVAEFKIIEEKDNFYLSDHRPVLIKIRYI